MPITVYHYPNCSSCRSALRFLRDRGLEVAPIDIVMSPPSAARLKQLWNASGAELSAFFNTSGESYRAGGFKGRMPSMSDAEKLAALAADGKLIKRPLLVSEDGKKRPVLVLVGFKEPAYEAAFPR